MKKKDDKIWLKKLMTPLKQVEIKPYKVTETEIIAPPTLEPSAY